MAHGIVQLTGNHFSKELPHIGPPSYQAVEILSKLYPLTGQGRYVFASARTPKGDRPMSNNAILAALRRLGIGKEEMTGHGFRAMVRTILGEVLGFRPDFIEHQLAHAVQAPNGRAYNRPAYLPERQKMMQAWADYLGQLRAGKEVGANAAVPEHPDTLASQDYNRRLPPMAALPVD